MSHAAPRPSPTPHGLGYLATVVESARQTCLLLLPNRFLWFVAAAELGLAAIGYLLAGYPNLRLDGRELYCVMAWWLLAGVVVPWTTIYLAVQAVHGEIEDRTFQYLFVRPVARTALVAGRFCAVAGIAAAVAVAGGAVLFAGVAARPDCWSEGVDTRLLAVFAGTLALGAVAYAAAGACIAACFRRPLVVAALAVILQMVVALLPMSAGIRNLTVADPLRRIVLDRIETGARLAQMLWPGESDFRSELVGQPELSLGIFTAVASILCLWAYGRSEYDSRSRE
ncbi:MAG: hypothetical protein FJ265_20290 [Planctomycetes bacterium]|nr:hypothetical protein [Planctomycetota bacterium]